ncbi:nucleotidyltransferase-like protein [Paenibacillus macquariensis]|uniref:Nucleotidyltransferase-like n=1 Tax=Paenibacillus macquariensis TaxID=948756 RepID=A0ABY1K8D8_9BACL|nr:nucleotidyltransferase-like protein [Paenibacillus macquariensis]MEC0093224.1 nucleotidyltransferase-like protein [Paenibacillus macquariensis]OAB27607.1 hypothetical protein PMSM_25415 [Paenibacillus macquariensis subsp. macquariensis]SIR40220.1 Nucleotidyltransferase-like [Paenibacillus macquariensis]
MKLSNLYLQYKEVLDEDTLGAIVCQQHDHNKQGSPFHDYDILILVVQASEQSRVDHVTIGGKVCQVFHVSLRLFRRWLIEGEKCNLVKCLLEGDIIIDTEGVLANLSLEFEEFKQPLRDQVMFLEFSRFLWLYLESKRYMSEGYIMDAYHSVIQSLHHWARIELIERGIRPQDKVWEQVRGLSTAVHKLYEELTVSKETLKQRVELVLLGCEFSVLSKMAECSVLLISVIGSREKPWSVRELLQHPELEIVSEELPLVLRMLVYRSIIKEVKSENMNLHAQHNIFYSTL